MRIDNELKNLIPPLAEDELKQLETNIKNEGWRSNERILTWNDFIIDGHNRHKICTKNNIEFKSKEMKFKDKNAVILWMIDNQLGRRNIPDYARVELNLKKEEIYSGRQGKPVNIDGFKGETREIIAKQSKVATGTVSKVKFIRDNADEEIKTKLRSGHSDISINKAYNDCKAKEKRKKALEVTSEPITLEKKDRKYKIIYADPPWKYFASGNKNQSIHYPNMEMEEIKKLPIQELADDNCILFIWVTFPILKEAFEVIESWGFEYSTCGFNWVKRNKKSDSWFFGLGNWTRSNSEICLIAKRGNPVRQSASVSQIIDTPIQEHSKKPDCVRDKIVELVGDLPRIELFARNKTKGWDVWGNEVK